MKFDVIIGNPPYQMNTGVVKENYAVPIFQKFVRNAKKLNPKYLTMIIPARWYTGGRGLNDFRMEMKSDKRISKIVDFIDSRDCFPGVDVSGGIMYFLWDKNHEGKCEFTNIIQGESHTKIRDLSKESVIVRMNNSQTIIEKVKKKSSSFLDKHVSPQTPFGLHTNFVGYKRQSQGMIKVKSSKGIQYIEREKIKKNTHLIDRYKVSFSKATSEHGGQQSKNKSRLVFSSLSILEPGEICTQSYLVVSIQMNKQQSDNLLSYLKTKFLRFLLFQSLSSQDISRDKFCFVPELNLNTKWTDEILYEKFELNDKEITLIENTIREIN
jgi:site-specific DNA-methyltransferase (adenine-specific)